MIELTDKDRKEIAFRGSEPANVEEQLQSFEKGFPSIQLVDAPTVGNGILRLTESEIAQLTELYDKSRESLALMKFVPASGAATRMFKDLYKFLSEYDESEEAYNRLVEEGERNSVFVFLKNLGDFAFYQDLKNKYYERYHETLEEGQLKRRYKAIIETLLYPEGLGYGELPKALLKFHKYGDGAKTSLEEHFTEGAMYAKGKGNTVHIHFTVSTHHEQKFKEAVAGFKKQHEDKHQVNYIISYSVQNTGTDTIAVNPDNTPFRETDGSLLFRPAGHGALLENLNQLDADIIFIKNIDNVVPEKIQGTTYKYKKALAGKLLEVKGTIYQLLSAIDSEGAELGPLEDFVFNTLSVRHDGYRNLGDDERAVFLRTMLDRPVRICGVVKNEGEPGGGPFFCQNADGSVTLQIVESAQVGGIEHQQEIFKSSTHFNPVDIVCSTRNYKNEKMDLLNYRDMDTGFITEKTKDGKSLKAMELPGLWNGAMANWITLFVEVPAITFNPVKKVQDLLKDHHR